MTEHRPHLERLPTVTTTRLSKRPAEVLGRTARGERLIVCHRKKPVATLQPLDGYVFQPFSGAVEDVFGWPVGTIEDEVAKLSFEERVLMTFGYRDWRLRPTRPVITFDLDFGMLVRTLEQMGLKGLVVRGWRGYELTGRGLALREALLRSEGRDPYGQDQTLPGSLRDSKTC